MNFHDVVYLTSTRIPKKNLEISSCLLDTLSRRGDRETFLKSRRDENPRSYIQIYFRSSQETEV